MVAKGYKPEACIVGEPTSMQVVVGHKGKKSYATVITGAGGHSSRAPELVNAVEAGGRLVAKVADLSDRLAAEGRRDDLYDIPHSTAHVGTSMAAPPSTSCRNWRRSTGKSGPCPRTMWRR